MSRHSWAFCELCQTVSLPPEKVAAVARPSIGRQATRWLTMSCSTTTSQASNGASSVGYRVRERDVGAGRGEQQGLVRTAAAGPTTAGSGS